MSQLDRQRAYEAAKHHRAQLEDLIARFVPSEKHQAVMRLELALLWTQADHAAGGPECRP